jgi:hypothetical protein
LRNNVKRRREKWRGCKGEERGKNTEKAAE